MKYINESEIKKFLDYNGNDILINEAKVDKCKNPDVSIIILMYNQANCIHKCIRSIQNQSLKNIEIIIIDDCSLDNSTETIEYYKKNDKRIILLTHDRNYGKIKSRSDGVRMARGRYITFIDGDDAFIHKDILQNSFNLATSMNLDVVDFRISFYSNKTFINNINTYDEINNISERIIYQPELRTKFISLIDSNDVRGTPNRNICGKFIKATLFKKVVKYIGIKYTEDFINDYEDTLMVIALLQLARSLYLMKERGYYYTHDECQSSKLIKGKKCKENKKNIGMDPIKYLNFLIDKTEDTKLERKLLYSEIITIDCFLNMTFLVNDHFEIIYNILDKTLESNYLTEIQKNKIRNIKYKLLNKEKTIRNK